jgi:hypothetical protein
MMIGVAICVFVPGSLTLAIVTTGWKLDSIAAPFSSFHGFLDDPGERE